MVYKVIEVDLKLGSIVLVIAARENFGCYKPTHVLYSGRVTSPNPNPTYAR